MHKKNTEQKAGSISKRRALIIYVGAAVAIIVPLMLTMTRPERSVEAFCKVYSEENARLATAHGDSYAVAVFDHKSSNPGDFAKAFSKLERVAPDEIRPDVKTLRQIFERIERDPSQALSASLSGITAEASVENWGKERCN